MPARSVGISIIIPVFNGAGFIAEAVASLPGANPEPLEIVVVDDGSSDGTGAVVARLEAPVRYARQPNRGPAAVRNAGLRLARYPIVGFLDADDLWVGSSLAKLHRYLQEHPRVDGVKGLTQFLGKQPDGTYRPLGKPLTFWNLGGALFRREVFDRFGGFDEELRYSEDIDWFLRVREEGGVIDLVPEVTQCYRQHGGNMTHGRNPTELNILKVLKSSLDRRRGKGAAGK